MKEGERTGTVYLSECRESKGCEDLSCDHQSGEREFQCLPESSGVIGVEAVSQFVDDDIGQDFGWQEEEGRIKRDDAVRRAAAPL